MTTVIREEFLVTCSHINLLESLKHLRFATAEQLCRLHYSPNSIQWVKAMLKELADNGYVKFGRRPTTQGRHPYYYFLTSKGFRSLASRDVTERFYVPDVNSPLFLNHALGLRDVVISAVLLNSYNPAYNLRSLRHDYELKRQPYKTGKLTLIPDAFLDLRFPASSGKKLKVPVIVEFDCGTERQQIFQQKIRAYNTFLSSNACKETFNASRVIVAFVTFLGEKRRDDMRKWAKKELGSDRSLYSSLLFTTQPQPPEPSMWLGPCWYTVDGNQPVSLLVH